MLGITLKSLFFTIRASLLEMSEQSGHPQKMVLRSEAITVLLLMCIGLDWLYAYLLLQYNW